VKVAFCGCFHVEGKKANGSFVVGAFASSQLPHRSEVIEKKREERDKIEETDILCELHFIHLFPVAG
jgi:hypothetical protein